MPAASTNPDIFLYRAALVGEHHRCGFMLATIADRLGVSLRRAERMAIAAAKAGLVKLEFGTIT